MADDRGRPVAFALTPGNVADISMAVPLLSIVSPPRRLIADKAYDAESLRQWLKGHRIKAVIPSTATRTVPYPLNRAVYRLFSPGIWWSGLRVKRSGCFVQALQMAS